MATRQAIVAAVPIPVYVNETTSKDVIAAGPVYINETSPPTPPPTQQFTLMGEICM